MFKPSAVYYEEESENYILGKELLDKFKKQGIPLYTIESHNNIPEMRSKQNSEFPKMKNYLIIGTRKTHKYVPNTKTSDFLVPFTSSGCTAMCLYCYLVCNYNKCAYLRLFVNREKMMDKLIKTTKQADKELVFEIGSNSDLVLENTITNNLPFVIETFGKEERGFITLPTKFSMVENILNCNHKGRTIIRMSLNPQEIISRVEFGTSNLEERIWAINKLAEADYSLGILVAPIILVEDWKNIYKNLIETLSEKLSKKAIEKISFEFIFMTYSFIHNAINSEAFPNAINLYNKDQMTGRGRGKYCYKQPLRSEGEIFIREIMDKYFPINIIEYIV